MCIRDSKYHDEFKNELSYNYSPIQNVGVYVPGGTASYPSTVLMNCIPALVAGVENIYLTTPAFGSDVNPAIIYAAKKCGVKEIYKTGGSHSISALTYVTLTFKIVDIPTLSGKYNFLSDTGIVLPFSSVIFSSTTLTSMFGHWS